MRDGRRLMTQALASFRAAPCRAQSDFVWPCVGFLTQDHRLEMNGQDTSRGLLARKSAIKVLAALRSAIPKPSVNRS